MVDNIRTIKDQMLYLLITNFYSEIDNNVLKKIFSRENVNLIDQILLDWIDNNNYSSKYFDFNSFKIILLLTIELELNKKYKSIKKASEELNIQQAHISGCCKMKKHYKTAGGYHWESVE